MARPATKERSHVTSSFFKGQTMSNPYEPPESNFSDTSAGGSKGPLGIGQTSLVSQVTVVAILMIVHGVMIILMGGFLAFFGLAGGNEFEKSFEKQMEVQKEIARKQRKNNPNQNAPDANVLGPGFAKGMTAGFAIMGGLVIASGLLSIVAGILNLRFKGRGLGITSLVAGFGASLTCYCAPTSIALGIYGLVVYLNSDVARAFAAVKEGHTPAEVKDAARGIVA